MAESKDNTKNLSPWVKEIILQRQTMFGPMVMVETDDERRFRAILQQRPRFVDINGGEEWYTLENWKGLRQVLYNEENKKIDYNVIQDTKMGGGSIYNGMAKAEEFMQDEKHPMVLVIKGLLQTDPFTNNVLFSWATNMDVMNKKSTIILFLEDRTIIPQSIWSHMKIVVPPKSTEDEREADLKNAIGCGAMEVDKKTMPSAVRLLAGLNLDQTDALITELSMRNHQKMDLDMLAKLKTQILSQDPVIDVINPPKFGFEAVGGYDALKKRIINDIVMPIKYPDYAKEYGVDMPRGLILFGPPGCGKTILAKALQKELNMTMVTIQADKIFSKWVGESEKSLRRVFQVLYALQPCLPGDTDIILTDGRIKKIKDVVSGDEIFSITDDGIIEKEVVINKSEKENHERKLVKIMTNVGEIKCTPDHKIPIYDGHNGMHWKKACTLSISDKIITAKDLPMINERSANTIDLLHPTTRIYSKALFAEAAKLKKDKAIKKREHNVKINFERAFVTVDEAKKLGLVENIDFEKCHFLLSRGGWGDSCTKMIKLPQKINEKFFYLFGIIFGDGHINKARKSAIQITNKDQSLLQYCNQICSELGISSKIYEYNYKIPDLKVSSAVLVDLYRRVTENILSFDKKNVAAWLQGVCDAEGYIQKDGYRRIIIAQNTPKHKVIRLALLKMGIVASVNSSAKCRHIEITDRDNLQKFKELIGFRHGEKSQKLDKMDLNYKSKTRKEFFRGAFLANIKTIEIMESEEHVYDLSTPKNHNFMINEGQFVHNCIFFVDELDKYGRRSTGPSAGDDSGGAQVNRQIFSMLLEELGNEDRSWIFFANTNLIEVIDPAMIRTGRVDSVVPVPYPDEAARVEILKIHALKKRSLKLDNINWKELALATEYWSGSDLESLVVRTANMKMENAIKSGSKVKITMEDFNKTYDTFNIDVNENKRKQKEVETQAVRFTNDWRLKDIFSQAVDGKSFDTRMENLKKMSWEERAKEGANDVK